MTRYTLSELNKDASRAKAEVRKQYDGNYRVYFEAPQIVIDGQHVSLSVPFKAWRCADGVQIESAHNTAI